jgi:hypothetical protein
MEIWCDVSTAVDDDSMLSYKDGELMNAADFKQTVVLNAVIYTPPHV